MKVIGVDTDEQGFGFCGSQRLVRVMTEKIMTNLSNINNLNGQDQLKVLFHALKGFNCTNKRVGPCTIDPTLIGINDKGEIKVWVNENYSLNKVP